MNPFQQKLTILLETHHADPNFNYLTLCQQLGRSRSQVYRLFKAAALPPPSVYIRNFRLAKAAELLKTTELSVKEIAYQVGYRSSAHFSDNFKDKYDTTPLVYRQEDV